jgi:hypothetical protein
MPLPSSTSDKSENFVNVGNIWTPLLVIIFISLSLGVNRYCTVSVSPQKWVVLFFLDG